MTHLGDITKIDWFHVPPVGVVTRRHFGEDEWHDIEIFEKWAQEEEGL